LIHGYYGFGNVGDEAILSVVMDWLRAVFGDVEFVVLSSNPVRTKRIHDINAVRERLSSLRFWNAFLRSHVVVFAGGGTLLNAIQYYLPVIHISPSHY